jgi:hypothetical protein
MLSGTSGPSRHRAPLFFLRAFGLIYLIAFVSFWIQADGLVGHDGIIPVTSRLERLGNHFGAEPSYGVCQATEKRVSGFSSFVEQRSCHFF